MTNAGKTTLQLNQANSFYNANDRIILVYGVDTANTANSLAQTATMAVNTFGSSISPYIQVSTQQPDPANATTLGVQQGTLFFSNSFGYIAIANNVLRRFVISSF